MRGFLLCSTPATKRCASFKESTVDSTYVDGLFWFMHTFMEDLMVNMWCLIINRYRHTFPTIARWPRSSATSQSISQALLYCMKCQNRFFNLYKYAITPVDGCEIGCSRRSVGQGGGDGAFVHPAGVKLNEKNVVHCSWDASDISFSFHTTYLVWEPFFAREGVFVEPFQ